MKKKIGELYDKPIVVGNPNEFTKNEIALRDLGGEVVDDGMEYYLVLDVKSYHFYLENESFPKIMGFMSSIISSNNGLNKVLVVGTQPGFKLNEYIAFSTSDKFLTDRREGISVKQYLINIFTEKGISLDDTTKFKRITAKEYYSLLK